MISIAKSLAVRPAALMLSVGLAVAAPAAQPGAQEAYPSQPIRIVVGFSAGSSTDVASRIIAQELSESLGQRVVVENKPGAASNVATQTVAGADPDGYTLLMGTVANTINTALGRKVDFDFKADFAPIALVGAVPMILAVHPEVPADSIDALIALAKEKPGGLTYGSAGVGTAPHLSAELFAASVGAEMVHVPYNGSGEAAKDLVAGRIDLMFAPASSVVAQIDAGTLRGLATSLSRRAAAAPDLPTVAESGIAGFNTSVWFGLLAPAGTPDDIVSRLSGAVNDALATEAVADALRKVGIEPLGGSPDELAGYIDGEIASWSKVVEKAGIKVD